MNIILLGLTFTEVEHCVQMVDPSKHYVPDHLIHCQKSESFFLYECMLKFPENATFNSLNSLQIHEGCSKINQDGFISQKTFYYNTKLLMLKMFSTINGQILQMS